MHAVGKIEGSLSINNIKNISFNILVIMNYIQYFITNQLLFLFSQYCGMSCFDQAVLSGSEEVV